MTEILLELNKPFTQGRKELVRELKKRVRTAFGGKHPCRSQRYVRDGFRRFIEVAGRRLPGLKLWGFWYYHGTGWFGLSG